MVKYVGEIMEAGNDEGIREDNGGREVEVSRSVVSLVDERIKDVEIEDFLGWEEPTASLVITPSPIVTFLFASDARTWMPEVRTSSEKD